jgi:hypothetical protein
MLSLACFSKLFHVLPISQLPKASEPHGQEVTAMTPLLCYQYSLLVSFLLAVTTSEKERNYLF